MNEPPAGDDATRVFVSYSRHDGAFVDRLESGLTASGVATLRDRDHIASLEAWRERIVSLIGQAHSVVFVLSPNWVASNECRKELELAVELQKRLAPIVHVVPDAVAVPEALRRLNWVSFADADRFDRSLTSLVTAFQTDIGWIREHARIGEQARYWARDERPDGALLRDQALFAAERWMALRPDNAPAPTPLLMEYLTRGRAVYEREERARKELLDRTLVSQSRMLAEHSRQILDSDDAVSALLMSLEALPDESQAIVRPDVPAAAVICNAALRERRERRVFSDREYDIYDVAISDDGSRVFALRKGGASVWDAATGALLASVNGDQPIISTDGARLAMIDGKSVQVWRVTPPALLEAVDLKGKGTRTLERIFAKRARLFVGHDGEWTLVDLGAASDPLLPRKPAALKGKYATAAFSADGTRVVTTPDYTYDFPTTVEVWDAETGDRVAELKGHKILVRDARFSPDGSRVATAAADGTARIWNARTGRLSFILRGHKTDVATARFSPDGSMLVTGSYDNSFRLWKVSTGRLIAVLKGHAGDIPYTTDIIKGFVPRARFSADDTHVVTTWRDGTARLWSVDSATDLQTVLRRHTGAVNSVAYHPSGREFVTASDDKTIIVWDAATLEPLTRLGPFRQTVSDVAFDVSGTRLAGAVGNDIVVWDAATSTEVERVPTDHTIWSLAFSPDGTRVAVTSLMANASVWDLSTGRMLSRLNKGDSGYCVRFAPSGIVAASCGDERAVRLWNVETGRQVAATSFQGHSVMSIAFDARGRRIVAGCADLTARIWTVGETPTDDNMVVLSGHHQGVNSAAFSPNGDQVVTASEDNTVRLWNSATGEQVGLFSGHTDDVARAVFNPSGTQIVSVSRDGTVRVWTLFPTTQSLVDHAKRAAPRALTPEQREEFFLDAEPPAWCIEEQKWPFVRVAES